MRWDALDGGLWSLPTKTTPHLLPLPRFARDVVATCPRLVGSPFVFPSNKLTTHMTTYSNAKEALDAAKVEGWTFHDLRRTMASTFPALGVDETVSEMIQNHKLPASKVSAAGRVYNRYKYVPQQREALEKWADYVAGLKS
jgi:integrase